MGKWRNGGNENCSVSYTKEGQRCMNVHKIIESLKNRHDRLRRTTNQKSQVIITLIIHVVVHDVVHHTYRETWKQVTR